MMLYDVNRALQDYLRPFDAVHERTMAIRSACASQKDTHGKKMRHSASTIILHLDRLLTCAALVGSWVLTTSNSIVLGGPSPT